MIGELDASSESSESTIPSEADFLFHLYRGSELLHDNRLLEAQSELEYAIQLEPTDARTRGLLAVVYFRSGFYARAIASYETLLERASRDPTLRLNLALCYLKTGQAEAARLVLKALVAEDVRDLRAWGYLALALERLGYVDHAREAFERAGQPDLARRMVELRGASKPRPTRASPGRLEDVPSEASVSSFDALDSGELRLELAGADPHSAQQSVAAPASLASRAPRALRPRFDTLGWGTMPTSAPSPAWTSPPPLATFLEDARVERLETTPGVALLGIHLARVDLDTDSVHGFAFRVDALRSVSGTLDPEILARQTRPGATTPLEHASENFGGIGTPFAWLKGPGQVFLGPRSGQRLRAFRLEDEIVFFREGSLVGFDLSLAYENGRLAVGTGPGGDGMSLVQLHGTGTLLVELASDLLSIDVKGAGLTVRKDVVIGWVGRLLPRTLAVGEAPCGQRGLIAFSGEGTLLVAAK